MERTGKRTGSRLLGAGEVGAPFHEARPRDERVAMALRIRARTVTLPVGAPSCRYAWGELASRLIAFARVQAPEVGARTETAAHAS